MTRNTQIARAVRFALLASTAAVASAISPAAQAQAQGASAAPPIIEEITVTGSRIRRVDNETADPVLVIDNSTILQSGATTVGDILQRIPEVAGGAVNPQVNNGGGFAESNISLRGLGGTGVAVEPRVVILIDGRRYGIIGASGAQDVNIIPANVIERVEVLKEGAGAVYGSDAVAGVVNFITRKNLDGAETSFQYNETSRRDGDGKTLGLTLGTHTDKLSLIFGGSYMQQDGVTAAARDFSKNSLGLYTGSVIIGGSSRTAGGRYFLNSATLNPADAAQQASLRAMYAAAAGTTVARCSSITKIAGTDGSTLADYRCRNTALHPEDNFNFQPFNLILTPQERGALFSSLNYEFNDFVGAYAEVLYNRTRSGFQIAPLPFDTKNDSTVISKDSMFNPFGLNFGGLTTPFDLATVRTEQLGDRFSKTASDTKQLYAGLRGKLPNINWDWSLGVSYGRLDQDANINGYFFLPLAKQAFGPSMLVNGVPTCVAVAGDPTTAISGCTPVNFFNINDPSQAAALKNISSGYGTSNYFATRGANLDLTGKVYDLPAGPLMAAVGLDYGWQFNEFSRTYDSVAVPPLYLSCQLNGETCGSQLSGGYSQKAAYGEVLVPVLKDLPGVKALNVSAGVRYSDYSNFGGTTKGQFKLEYRPVRDLLARSTFAQVFRAPGPGDLFAGLAQNAATFVDPCNGLTAAKAASNPAYATLCQYVPQDGTFQNPNSQSTGLTSGNPNLKPEAGNVLTYGLVYDSSWLPGFSADVDFWRYKIDQVISLIEPQFAATECLATNSPTFCGYFHRQPSSGQILFINQPTNNLGQLKTNGVDLGVKYVLKDTSIGGWRFSLDATRIGSFQTVAAPGSSPVDYVGQFNKQFGNFAKWRAFGQAGWTYHGFDALVTLRWIDKIDVLNPDGGDPTSPGYVSVLHVPSFTYVDLNFGYTFKTKTKLQIGAVNLGDKLPPLLYSNNTVNANTDVSTYDSLGRRYFIGLVQSF